MWDLPPIQPVVTEYQRHRLICPGCGESTCGDLPPGVPTGQSRPALVAFAAFLMAYFRQSQRRTAEFGTTVRFVAHDRHTVLNIPCSAGLVVKHQRLATQATRPACRQEDRNPVAYLTSAVEAHFHGQSTPSLLPEV